jgi:hypothetical protein
MFPIVDRVVAFGVAFKPAAEAIELLDPLTAAAKA